MRVLGIETTCDETAAAVVELKASGGGAILSNEIYSQTTEHAPFGGVVSELAARAHVEHLDGLIRRALAGAGLRRASGQPVSAEEQAGLKKEYEGIWLRRSRPGGLAESVGLLFGQD